jgi:serine/threonine-protein kinase
MEAGRVLAHYRLVEQIGEGGMGVVWKAVLPEAFADEAERLARFEREAKLLASLNHPNIATIHGLHRDGDVHFLVMELVPGENLDERLRRGPLAMDEALRVGRQVVDALEAAHENGE